MSDIFIQIFNLSITASWAVLVVVLLRFVLKKAPRWISCMLWSIVGLRLLLPFSLESAVSIIPSDEFLPSNITVTTAPAINSGINALNSAVNPIISNTFAPDVIGAVTPMQILIGISSYIWLVGIAVMLIYGGISYLALRKRVAPSICLRDNIYYCDNIDSPFILGVFRPRIYLPSGMTDGNMKHVIDHENAHLRRRDHIWKPLGFLILSVYWFNPIIWVAYILLCRDIERACDESVIKNMPDDAKRGYSETLLSCSIRRRGVTACPLAFGEVGVKDRIKSVLNYKKPAFWIIVVAIILCVAAAVCLLTVPRDEKSKLDDSLAVFIDSQIFEHHHSEKTEDNFVCVDYDILHTDSWLDETTLYMWVMYCEYSYENGIVLETASHNPTVISVKNRDGSYELMEYWTPRDGAYYDADIKSKFPQNLWNEALDSERYAEQQSAKFEEMAKTYYGLEDAVGFFSYDTGNVLSALYVTDYGCDTFGVEIDFNRVIMQDGELVFELIWNNKTNTRKSIGPNFELYRYDGKELIPLEQKGIFIDTNDFFVRANSENIATYDITNHYNITEPGKYRFEAHGAWIDFQIINYSSWYSKSTEYDSIKFDIDGDGEKELCGLYMGRTSGLFTFEFLVKNDRTDAVEYLGVFYTDQMELEFVENDGKLKIKGLTPMGEQHIFDVSVSGDGLVVTENGVPLDELKYNQ